MAHFRATIQGTRGEASRLGHKKSGIRASVSGWDSGVYVVGRLSPMHGEDVFSIWATSGSNGGKSDVFIGTVSSSDDGFVFSPAEVEKK